MKGLSITERIFSDTFHGSIPEDIRDLCSKLEYSDDSKTWQYYVAARFRDIGYNTILEYPCQYISGSGKSIAGRIDIMVSKNGIKIPVELDRVSIRQKSLAKLNHYSDWIALLRNNAKDRIDPDMQIPLTGSRRYYEDGFFF